MRKIDKGREPKCLAEERIKGTLYGDLSAGCKTKVQTQIFQEQFGVCGYCERSLDHPHTPRVPARIDHLLSQVDHPQSTMDYKNLVGSCSGSAGKQWTCDSEKNNRPLKALNPVSGSGLTALSYKEGKVIADSTDLQFGNDLSKDLTTLNLNAPVLIELRKAAVKWAQDRLRRSPNAELEIRRIFAQCTDQTRNGQLPPFVSTVLAYIEPKARHLGLLSK